MPPPPYFSRHKSSTSTRKIGVHLHDTQRKKNTLGRLELWYKCLADGLHESLCNEDGVEGSTAEELVAADKELEPLLSKDDALANPADLYVVALGRGEGHRILLVLRVSTRFFGSGAGR